METANRTPCKMIIFMVSEVQCGSREVVKHLCSQSLDTSSGTKNGGSHTTHKNGTPVVSSFKVDHVPFFKKRRAGQTRRPRPRASHAFGSITLRINESFIS